MSNNIVDLTVENFSDIVVEQSQQKLIAVYFWAAQDPVSSEFKATVEKLSAMYPEHMVTAMVNVEEEQQITAQFGVRGLPTIMLVKEGQPVDGAAGPMDEAQLAELLQKHLPKPEDELIQQAAELIEQGDYQQAYPLAKQAFEYDEERIESRFLLCDCAIELGQLEFAKSLLSEVKMVDQDANYQALLGKIELAEKASESPEIIELQQKLAADPENLDVKIQLAIQLQQAHKAEEALELLYQVVLKDINYGEAKKTFLDMINALPDGDALKPRYRRKIYSLLY